MIYFKKHFLGLAFVVLIDLLSKQIAYLYLKGNEIVLIEDFVTLDLVYNSGIAFSLPLEGILLKVITIILIIIIFLYYLKEEYNKKNFLIDFSFILILGGAIGNGYERIINGSVIDFISIKYFSVFNLADSFIFIGAIIYIIIEILPGITKKINNETIGKRNGFLTK